MKLCSIVWKCQQWSLLRKHSRYTIQIAFICIMQWQERKKQPFICKPIQTAFCVSLTRDNIFKQISYGIMQIMIELSFMIKIGFHLFRSAVLSLCRPNSHHIYASASLSSVVSYPQFLLASHWLHLSWFFRKSNTWRLRHEQSIP